MVNIYANKTGKTDFEMEEKEHFGVIDIALPENRDDANKNNPSYIKEYFLKKWNGIKRMQCNFCNACGFRVTNFDGISKPDNVTCAFGTIVLIYIIVNPLIYIIFTCLAFTINNDDIECMCRNGAYRVIAAGFGFTWLFFITCGSLTRNPHLVAAIYFLMSFGNLLMGRKLCFGPANANDLIRDPDNYTCVFDELIRNTTSTLQELTSPAPN